MEHQPLSEGGGGPSPGVKGRGSASTPQPTPTQSTRRESQRVGDREPLGMQTGLPGPRNARVRMKVDFTTGKLEALGKYTKKAKNPY